MTAGGSSSLTDDALSVAMSLPPNTIPVFAGYAAFASSLALSTLIQLKLLGVSTGSPRPIPSLLGLTSVALSSLASHHASVNAHAFCRKQDARRSVSSVPRRQAWQSEILNFGAMQIDKQSLRVCVLGLVSFKLFGGRFWAVAPSSYTHLGSFARFSLPATKNYATPSQRATLERLGRWAGCHTCGSHMLFRGMGNKYHPRFHGDHMPPKAVAQQMNSRWFRRLTGRQVKFRFYPQCVDCSNVQGGILSSATNELRATSSFFSWAKKKPNLQQAGGGKLAHFHGLRFRPFHLAGGVIAAVTVVDASDADIAQGNRRRYREIQKRIYYWGRDAHDFISSLIRR